MIKDIAFTAYPSANVKSTREWYEKMLGLKFSGAYEEAGVEKYNEANVGPGTFSLMTDEWIGRAPGSGVGVAFEVDDIEGTAKALREAGVSVDDIYTSPVCKVTSFDDPEGNKVTLHQSTR
ncbi:MAG TPA: VOC family protein [Candidatus Aquilonibacter sp.]